MHGDFAAVGCLHNPFVTSTEEIFTAWVTHAHTTVARLAVVLMIIPDTDFVVSNLAVASEKQTALTEDEVG